MFSSWQLPRIHTAPQKQSYKINTYTEQLSKRVGKQQCVLIKFQIQMCIDCVCICVCKSMESLYF